MEYITSVLCKFCCMENSTPLKRLLNYLTSLLLVSRLIYNITNIGGLDKPIDQITARLVHH